MVGDAGLSDLLELANAFNAFFTTVANGLTR